MTRRWLISIVLVLVLSIGLAACTQTPAPKNDEPVVKDEGKKDDSSNKDDDVKDEVEPLKEFEVTYLSVWAGGGANFPEDQQNNPIAQVIKEKFGLSFVMESITTNETEYLNTIFAAGTVPDFVNAPFWGTSGGEGKVILKAASEGQVFDLTDKIPNYPNIDENYDKFLAKDFKEYDLYHPDFNGRKYVIRRDMDGNDEDHAAMFGDAVYARADILEAIDVNPEDVKTPDDMYNLLVKIRDAGLKDFGGNDIIPLGTNHNGWRQENIWQWFDGNNISGYRQDDDGNVYSWQFDEVQEKRVLYMRKLVSENLIDKESFTQNNSQAQEKFAAGKVAVAPIDANLAPNLYYDYSDPDHPEAKWVLLGMENAEGNRTVDVYKKGTGGGGCFFFGVNTDDEKVDAVLNYIDYITTTEGQIFGSYGIEGVHYDMSAGYPKLLPEVKEKFDADPKNKNNEGVGQYNWGLINNIETLYPTPDEDKAPRTLMRDQFRAQLRPRVVIDKVSANYLDRDYPGLKEFQDRMSTIDYEAEMQRAYFADSDEEALAILEDVRKRIKDAGIDDVCSWVQEKAAGRDDIGF